ncbi:MAG TPA: hypothetical protein DCP28_36835, partial [Cytophagales bacterium]|nr:hypothetical protein [Cytophagales bacterium]
LAAGIGLIVATGGIAAPGVAVVAAKVTTGAKIVKALSTAAKAAKVAAPILSLAGLVTGWISDGEDKDGDSKPDEPLTPTVTRGTIELTGELVTENVINTILMQLPGGDKVSDAALPYYDCPMGIFALENQPTGEKVVFNRLKGTEFYSYYDPERGEEEYEEPYYEAHTAYRGTSTFNFAVNDASGLEVYDIKVALMAEVATPLLGRDLLPRFTGYGIEEFSTIKEDIQTNKLYVVSTEDVLTSAEGDPPVFEPGIKVLGTRWVDPACFGDLSLNISNDHSVKVFVRVVAVLKKQGEDPETATPFVHMADYGINMQDNGTVSRSNFYTNYSIGSNNPESVVVNQSNVSTVANVDVETSGAVEITSGNDISYVAGSSILLNEGFFARPGSEFLATDDFGFSINCTSYLLDVVTAACGYNASAYRVAETLSEGVESLFHAQLHLYPNPTEGALTVQLQQEAAGDLFFVNLQGQEVMRTSWTRGRQQVEVNTEQWQPGLYVAVLQTENGEVYRQQVMVK